VTEVAVLYGGASAEREVSLKSGEACAAALYERGYATRLLDVGRDVGALVKALTPPPDYVFNALHGRYGEDGTVQGVLELMGLPYTHSGVLASALAMDKPAAKGVLAHAGLPTAEGTATTPEALAVEDPLPRPYVLKPAAEGSSVGVHMIDGEAGAADAAARAGERLIAERYVPGRELTVSVMGGTPLGVTELRPREGFYDYRNKYTGGATDHRLPAPVDPEVYARCLDLAARAHAALGCRGVTRTDLRHDDTGGEPGALTVLEVNTQPGMTELSLVPEQAAHAGIGFEDLVEWIVEDAACA